MATEIKPSFSLKYILLVLVTAAITSGITLLIQEYQQEDKVKKIALSVRGGLNEVSKKNNKESAVTIKYALKNDTAEVKGYYHKTITLTNIGTNGLEHLQCKVINKDTNIFLIPAPKFESYPKEIGQVEYDLVKNSDHQNIITLPLLNKGEGISISYEAYSKSPVPKFDLDVVIRQKDLEVKRVDNFVVKEDGRWSQIFFGFLTSLCIMVIIITMIIIIVISQRLVNAWDRSPETRKKYNQKFWKYWWEGDL
jgi:hypothetical protein